MILLADSEGPDQTAHRAVWSGLSLYAHDSKAHFRLVGSYVNNEGPQSAEIVIYIDIECPDQTVQMHSLIWASVVRLWWHIAHISVHIVLLISLSRVPAFRIAEALS